MDQGLLSAIDFIREYWVELSMLYIHQDVSSTYDLYDVKVKPNHRNAWWSCVYAGTMVKGFFTTPDSTNRHLRDYQYLESYTDIDNFAKICVPGNVYDFMINDHVFSLIYLDSSTLLYTDYYSETGRGRVSQIDVPVDDDDDFSTKGPDAFRIEVMTREKILTYLKDYISMDVRKEQEFHLGDLRFAELRSRSFQDDAEDGRTPVLGYKVTPITRIVRSPADVIKICWQSLYLAVNNSTDIEYLTSLPKTNNMYEAVRRVMIYGLTYGEDEDYDQELVHKLVLEYMKIADKMIKLVGSLDPINDGILMSTGIVNTGLQDYFV